MNGSNWIKRKSQIEQVFLKGDLIPDNCSQAKKTSDVFDGSGTWEKSPIVEEAPLFVREIFYVFQASVRPTWPPDSEYSLFCPAFLILFLNPLETRRSTMQILVVLTKEVTAISLLPLNPYFLFGNTSSIICQVLFFQIPVVSNLLPSGWYTAAFTFTCLQKNNRKRIRQIQEIQSYNRKQTCAKTENFFCPSGFFVACQRTKVKLIMKLHLEKTNQLWQMIHSDDGNVCDIYDVILDFC